MMVRVFRCAGPTLGVLAATISIPACAMEDDLDPSRGGECSPIDADAKDHDLLAEIEAMGFCASTAIDLGDEYLVEGDISLSKARLSDKQRRFPNLVSTDNVEWMTVRVDAALPATWRTATQDAIAAWNNATATAVHFQFTNAAVANISVVDDGGVLPPAAIADGEPPSNNLPGYRIRINTSHNSLPATNQLTAMAHELGHTIGFHHTDDPTQIWIPNTPVTDAASVMNAANKPWTGLSPGDIDAVRILYPYRVNSFTSEFTGCSFGIPRFVLNWGPGDGGVVDWQLQRLSGGTYVNHYQGPSMGISFSGSSSTQYTFRVRANTILGPTAWKTKGFQAPNCSGPNPL